MASLKDILHKSSSYLSTTARLFGVDPWPLEHMPDKKPESLPELLQAVKSLLAYFLRQWAEVEDHLNQATTNSAEVKSAKVQNYVSGDKSTAGFHEEQKQCERAIEDIDRQVKTMKKHSAMHMEDINFLKDLQANVVELVVLDAKVASGFATINESSEHAHLTKQTKEMYYSFVAGAVKRQDEMEDDDESGDEEFVDCVSDEHEAGEEGLKQAMEKLEC
ncbi:hypothetical protein EPUS_06867 [Endocarpon pusillum Z07020]|uniref:Uncharacterized protein n=1 Tax=Endocarpon pusillum (strain Z07020 / HMAS-L-300199) TaxID=1263415 RepID=U1I4F8_ENDPU|nr:uncharacterized protein EPUS_06867 [Endocarpon pusillum Z07020]ERF76999.1 hypothetical protein EPUS_06867 [Endocarpon pusillum Z07020]